MKSRIQYSPFWGTGKGPETGEALLLDRARGGDTRAFEGLYRAYVGRIYALCMRLCGSAGQAEELTQTAFVRAWERLDTCRGEGGFFPWMRRLTINVVLQENRAKQRRELRVVAVEDPDIFEAPRPAGAEVKIDLERTIADLPEGARTVLVLHDLEGYTHEEIAAMTGTAEGTCKAQLHRARRLLREAMER